MEHSLKNISPISSWHKNYKRPLIIAGPCSAESEEQVLQTANQLKETKIDFFRAGIWKPRTRPGSFEGIGSVGLPWLKKVKELTGIPVATEVANVKHVYECLKAGVDMLWIGARTTVNPFAVQEIAESLKGVDVIVLVKNPVNPDVDLWIGAIERIYHAGIKNIAAVHRGVSLYEKSKYRNDPQWEIPSELRRILPEVPLICDPSHICGQTDGLLEISQNAMDLEFEGLMIESHCNPEKALSDAKQQLTPFALKNLLSKLVLRNKEVDLSDPHQTLTNLRNDIDNADKELLALLFRRFKIAEEIGKYKKANNITILQSNRWEELVSTRINQGKEFELSKDFILNLFKAIHTESINKQTNIMKP